MGSSIIYLNLLLLKEFTSELYSIHCSIVVIRNEPDKLFLKELP